jgi:phosphate transport system substrate-binding protein
MKLLRCGAGFALLITFLVNPFASFAQEDEAITLSGSQTVINIFESLSEAGELEVTLDSSVTGTTEGFNVFCQGETDIVAANRPMTIEEEVDCIANEIEYAEYLVGYDALVVIAHPEIDFLTCLTEGSLRTLFAPSAQNDLVTWDQTGQTEIEDLPVSVYLPEETSTVYMLLDQLASGFGLRNDVTVESTDEAIISAVSSTPGAIGVVRLNETLDFSGVQIIDLYNSKINDCYTPSGETVDTRQYVGANRLFAYVNSTSMDNAGVNDVLAFVTSDEAATTIAELGFLAPTDKSSALNQAILSGTEETGRQFSKDVIAFQIPSNLFGAISISGSATLSEFLQIATQQFSYYYNGVTIDLQLAGTNAGLRRLCNNELDMLAISQELTADQLQDCVDRNISLSTIDLGKQAVVVLAHEGDTYLECLTTDQIIQVWGNTENTAPVNWIDVADDFPEAPILLVAPGVGGTNYTDLLLKPTEGAIVPARSDAAETNADPFYRAAAVGNVEGSLTYMSWQQYLFVLENGQTNIQPVAINNGNDCVEPSEDTILNGEYPLTAHHALVVNQYLLNSIEKQAFLWFLHSDENYAMFEYVSLIGPRFSDLPDMRENLQLLFEEVLTVSPPVMPEATPEATPETSD